ncbi:DUF7547 family protein [Halohasta salina]|uniref:DUF7547 family protein n=1 Tax=Halohasta salina TaxID=2961621 RepID=UPI0020A44BD9|nr:hypothetical protein [Halohasta salina]
MSSRDRPRDREPLDDRLDELESTLAELRTELDRERRRGPPKPPSLGELLRFTEEYTIPTLIALLEATIQSLELLRRTLRLADPQRAVREEREAARGRLDRLGSEAGDQLAGALSELRSALSEADLPENPESRRLIEDARDLTGEIETRLRDAEGTVRDHRDRERRDRGEDGRREDGHGGRDRGVMIDVTDADETTTDADDSADDSTTDPDVPEVDVESELESIKDELDRVDAANAASDTDSEAADGSADDGSDPTDSDVDADDPADRT